MIPPFAQHALLRTMRAMTTWFCDAYASWQKGGVENANGRLRRWLPRQIDIDQVSDEEIQDIVITANLTPRKCLGFKKSGSRKFGQRDRWSFCLIAGTLCPSNQER